MCAAAPSRLLCLFVYQHVHQQSRRKCKRGRHAGILCRTRRRSFNPPLPSILLANSQSLENKIDELNTRIRFQRNIESCCVLALTEMWLSTATPNNGITFTSFTTYRQDRNLDSELNLNGIEAGDVGVKKLSDLLKDPYCKLEKLQLQYCNITGEGCADLVKALKSNPSYLKELNLKNNKLGDSGVKELSKLLEDPQCKLETLQLSECKITDKNCADLFEALKSNPSSFLRELNLSGNKTEYSTIRELSKDLLKDSRCKLEKLEY
ncbi:hypothetical protein MHYP_G00363570 [Metynnis hypsauchen]